MSLDKFHFVQVTMHVPVLEHLKVVGLFISGCESDVIVGNSSVDMYAKCGSMEDAWRVFNTMPSQNVVTWSAMILGHMLLCFNDHRLYDFCKIATLHLHLQPVWPC
jgi:pentatricopeptide repeat protein